MQRAIAPDEIDVGIRLRIDGSRGDVLVPPVARRKQRTSSEIISELDRAHAAGGVGGGGVVVVAASAVGAAVTVAPGPSLVPVTVAQVAAEQACRRSSPEQMGRSA